MRGAGIGLAAGPQGFSADPQVMAWWRPDTGYVNRIGSSPFGNLAEFGGAVATLATAGPNATPVYNILATSGGTLKSVGRHTYAGPLQMFVVLQRTGADAFGYWLAGIGTQSALVYNAGDVGVLSGTNLLIHGVDSSVFHSYDALFWGSSYGGISLDGGAYTRGEVAGSSFGGIVIGSAGDDSVRANIRVADVILVEGRASQKLTQQIYKYLQGRYPSLALGTPAYVADHAAPPPWTYTSPWDCWLEMGQSNGEGLGTTPATAFGANNYVLGYDFVWKAATDPICAVAQNRDTVNTGVSVATHAGQAGFMNLMQPHYGRPLVMVPVCAGGSSQSPEITFPDIFCWEPSLQRGLKLPDSLYGSLLARAKEAQFRGGTIRGLIIHQGESEGQAADNPTQDLWIPRTQNMIDSFRRDLNLPGMPVIYSQIQPAPSATYAAIWARMRNVVQPQLASSNVIMVSVPDGPYIAASAVDHLHLDTAGLEAFYALVATAAIAHGY